MTHFLLALLLVSGSAVDALAGDRVSVYVSVDETADSDDRKSIKDLREVIEDSKTLRLAESRDAADVVLDVLNRETSGRASATLFGWKKNSTTLSVRVLAGESSTEVTGTVQSKGYLTGYKDAAKKVVQQVEQWVETNRARLQ